MQLDPGFTREAFWANAAVEFVAAFFGTLGALAVAIYVYRKTRDDQRSDFSAQLAHDLKLRRDEDRSQRAAVHLALYYELADNLDMLGEFWPHIVDPERPNDDAGVVGQRLANTAVPAWNTAVWQGAAGTVALAVTPNQLSGAYRVYKTLANVLAVQRRLESALSNDAADYAGQPVESDPLGRMTYKIARTQYFADAANRLVPKLANEVGATLEAGNPIPRPEAAVNDASLAAE